MILFDYDGVLANSKAICLEACAMAARDQGRALAFDDDAFAELDPLTFEALALAHGLEPASFAASVARHVAEAGRAAPAFPGVVAMIEGAAARFELAVVSASASAVITGFLEENHIAAHFAAILGGDLPGAKADKIAALLGDDAGRHHLFVGDAVSDMQAGRQAGLSTAAAFWGWQSRTRLLGEDPDLVATSPTDLYAKITGFGPLEEDRAP